MKRQVIRITKTCSACPEQYEGKLNTGEQFCIYTQWGKTRLDIPHGNTIIILEYENKLQSVLEPDGLERIFHQADIEFIKELFN